MEEVFPEFQPHQEWPNPLFGELVTFDAEMVIVSHRGTWWATARRGRLEPDWVGRTVVCRADGTFELVDGIDRVLRAVYVWCAMAWVLRTAQTPEPPFCLGGR